MNTVRPGPHNLQALPTLTEVVELPASWRRASVGGAATPPTAAPAVGGVASSFDAVSPALPEVSEQVLVQRVLTDLQRHADLMLEYRLREAMAPALARLADSLIQELRQELAATLRDVVARAVSQEVARQRGR
jgi:hypothetical protein